MEKELNSPRPSASAGLPQRSLSSAFRLDALALNADLAALNKTKDELRGWALDEAFDWLVRALGEDVKSLAAARGTPVPGPEHAMADAARRLRLMARAELKASRRLRLWVPFFFEVSQLPSGCREKSQRHCRIAA